MKNQHTPGPWKSTDNGIFANELNAHGNFYICRLPFVNEETSEKEKANLALISAAPDLLEALKFILADWVAINGDRLTGSRVPAEKAIAAIAKAEGVK